MNKHQLIAPILFLAITAGSSARLNAQKNHHGDHDRGFQFVPGTVVVSRSVYEGNASTVTIGEALPLGCQGGLTGLTVNVPTTAGGTDAVAVPCGVATDNGEYPNLLDSHNVWNNANSDGSFGVSSPIFLDDITTDGWPLGTLPIPTDQIVTSFSSKSELALNRSVDGRSITFMGYVGGSRMRRLHGFSHRAQSARCFGFEHARRLRSHQSGHHNFREQSVGPRGILPWSCRSRCRRPSQRHPRQRLQRRQRPRSHQGRQRPLLHGRQRQLRQPVEEANVPSPGRRRAHQCDRRRTALPRRRRRRPRPTST